MVFPEQPLFSTSTGVSFRISVKFGNIGSGTGEKFYMDVYNGSSWVTFYTNTTISNNVVVHIEESGPLFNTAVMSYIQGGTPHVKIRARVIGFQEKDYLLLGAYFITETYDQPQY